MDSTCWYRYARHHSRSTPWIVKRPNKAIFAGEKRRELNQKATRITSFTLIIFAFWFAFFRLMIGEVHTETYMFASFSSAAFSIFGRGWGLFEKILKEKK